MAAHVENEGFGVIQEFVCQAINLPPGPKVAPEELRRRRESAALESAASHIAAVIAGSPDPAAAAERLRALLDARLTGMGQQTPPALADEPGL